MKNKHLYRYGNYLFSCVCALNSMKGHTPFIKHLLIYLKSWVTGRTIETKRRQRVRHNFHLVHTPNAMARSGLKSGARGLFWASHVGTDAQELGLFFVAFQSVLPGG